MRKISLILFTGLLLLNNVYSQIEYKHFIGGSINSSASIADFKTDNLQNLSNQKVGFGFYYGFILNKFSIGFGMDALQQIQEYNNLPITESQYISIMFYPFVRYYFNTGLFVHSQFNFGVSAISKKYDSQALISNDDKNQQNYTLIGATIGLGYSIKVGERFLIEPMYKIIYSNNKPILNIYKSFESKDIMIDVAVIYKLK